MNIVHKTGAKKNWENHAIGCELWNLQEWQSTNQLQLAAIHSELRHQFNESCKGNPLWSTKAFIRTVREIEHHDAVNAGVFADKFSDKWPREWTRASLKALEEATDEYMIEVTAISNIKIIIAATEFL
jgi:hypothetical protein